MDGGELVRLMIEIIKKGWYRKSTLPLLVLFVIGVLLLLFSAINLQAIEPGEIGIGVFILFIVIAIWFYTNIPPRAANGKIGFAIGIKTDNPEQHHKIKRDFIDTLRKLLYESKYRYSFEFIELPDRIIEKINPDTAVKTLHDLRCSFMIYGKARTTTLKGQVQHVLDMEGVVAHKPIPQTISKTFSMEFASLFPKRKTISSEGDLFEFEVTANLIGIISKYIIGVASLISGDIGYSQELFEGLQEELRGKKIESPAIVKIRDRIPIRLRDIYLIRVRMCYQEWVRTKDVRDIEQIKHILDSLDVVSPGNHEARIFSSLWYFVVERDIAGAKNECVKGRDKRLIAWRYNYAFLLAYEGNLDKALDEYKHAFRGFYAEPRFIFDVVDFILWVLSIEPDKTQLYFCLGLIYFYKIKDYSLALQDLERFIEFSQPDLYSVEKREAEKLITTIQKDIAKGKIQLAAQ